MLVHASTRVDVSAQKKIWMDVVVQMSKNRIHTYHLKNRTVVTEIHSYSPRRKMHAYIHSKAMRPTWKDLLDKIKLGEDFPLKSLLRMHNRHPYIHTREGKKQAPHLGQAEQSSKEGSASPSPSPHGKLRFTTWILTLSRRQENGWWLFIKRAREVEAEANKEGILNNQPPQLTNPAINWEGATHRQKT